MIQLHFKMYEFVIIGTDVPIAIADKIIHGHMLPMNPVREAMGIPVYPSQKSGYRPYNYELNRGRSGNSQHTFGEKDNGYIDPTALGAVDWTCQNFAQNKQKLLELIIEKTGYTRIAVYDTFIHCDYKARDGKRYLFSSTSSSKWTFIKNI